MVDGGTENSNAAMEALVTENLMARILAETDVVESNSMIERFWLSAKHGSSSTASEVSRRRRTSSAPTSGSTTPTSPTAPTA